MFAVGSPDAAAAAVVVVADTKCCFALSDASGSYSNYPQHRNSNSVVAIDYLSNYSDCFWMTFFSRLEFFEATVRII